MAVPAQAAPQRLQGCHEQAARVCHVTHFQVQRQLLHASNVGGLAVSARLEAVAQQPQDIRLFALILGAPGAPGPHVQVQAARALLPALAD